MVCKAPLTTIESLSTLSFILTMWYVKGSIIFTLSPYSKSFILTMWYVKFVNVTVLSNILPRFILTMWYVKFHLIPPCFIKRVKFYINYVVCKD